MSNPIAAETQSAGSSLFSDRSQSSLPENGPIVLSRAALFWYAALLVAVALGYSLYTNNVWEDTLISLRCAENFVNGDGLTYQPGTRVQSYSSPLAVLLLSFCYFLTGKGSYLATMWLFRLFSIAAFAASGVLLLKAAARAVPNWKTALWWLGLVYLFDFKSVAFSTNGMETAFMLLFLAATLYLIAAPSPAGSLARGLCWAGLMWTRPDGCVYIAALAIAEFLFRRPERLRLAMSLVKSAAVCAAAYAPWLLWTWAYYGSLIPNTILAKCNSAGPIAQFWLAVHSLPGSFFEQGAAVFQPIYPILGNWLENDVASSFLGIVSMCVGIFCIVYWLIPLRDPLGKSASFTFAVMCLYFSYQENPSPWYLPPATMLGLLTLARGFTTISDFLKHNIRQKDRALVQQLAVILLSVVAICQIAVFVLSSLELRIQQAEIEFGTRAKIGAWLRDHGQPSDSVFLEPVGYIGYFSGMKMHDFPGLVSLDVIHLRQANDLNQFTFIPALNADWLVLRPKEVQAIVNSELADVFQEKYEFVTQFDAVPRLENYSFIPGQNFIYYDSQFEVYRRKPVVLPPT